MMMKLAPGFLALALSAMASAPALASPNGVWELDTRDTRIALELCGDGTQLCGQLVWLSDDDYNDRYRPYLDTPVATRIEQVGGNRWRGELQLFGHRLNGTITQRSEDQLTLQGCALLVICRSYEMFRVQP